MWLWAWPRLLGWPHAVHWLFSPVVGNRKHPGDLWGVDRRGNLIIVETKLDRGRSRQDPFEDFVRYSTLRRVQPLWQADALEKRWRHLLRQELAFVAGELERRAGRAARRGPYPGVVPYSRHRRTVWLWQGLYSTKIAPQFRDGRYERAVERALGCREAAGNPAPVFVGLVARRTEGDPVLSAAGRRALVALRSRVGAERAVLRAVRITRGPKAFRLQCWSPKNSV